MGRGGLYARRVPGPVKGLRVAVQEYGISNPDLLEALKQRGAEVFPVPIYRWALPEDTGPLKQVLGEIIAGNIQVMLVTNAAQIDHVMQILEQEGTTAQFRDACRKMVVASIGPTAANASHTTTCPWTLNPRTQRWEYSSKKPVNRPMHS
jgi:Uroporphyrinogen-III synthase